MARIIEREAVFAEICAQLIEGKSLRKICEHPDMPGLRTVMTWLNEDAALQQQYARARELQADSLADQILDIADTPVIGVTTKISDDGKTETTEGDMLQHRRLQVDARKWYASKLAPKKYGDKMELSGNAESPLTVQIVKLSDASNPTAE